MAQVKKVIVPMVDFNQSIGYEVIKSYGYRNAYLKKGVKFDREIFKELETKLTFTDGICMENHCVMILKSSNSSEPLAFYFHDLYVFIGSVENIVEESTF